MQNLFSCKVCDKQFAQRQSLQVHQEFHKNANAKKFACDLCELRFKSEARFVNHFQSHGIHNQKVYACEQTFSRYGISIINYIINIQNNLKKLNLSFISISEPTISSDTKGHTLRGVENLNLDHPSHSHALWRNGKN